jgi:hypothetical protein
LFRKITTAAAVALVGLGVGAAGASAYSISGGSYTATAGAYNTFTVGGAYQHECSNVSFEGEATGAASTTFTPVLDGCTFFGFPVFDQPSGPWTLTVTGGPVGNVYGVSLDIPAGTTTTLENPLWGYTISISGPQTIPNAGSLTNEVGGAALSLSMSNIDYDVVGGPFGSGNDLSYETNGDLFLPGVTVQ